MSLNPIRELKKFNQQIQITVEVDSIAEKLMGTFPEDYKHKEELTETIVGSMLTMGHIGYLYNSLNGFNNDIDFKVGDKVVCESKKWTNTPTEVEGKFTDVQQPIGECEVVAINLFSDNKLCVQYNKLNSRGEAVTDTNWVSHKKCTKWVSEMIQA
jgi:hypothetical protein